MSPRGVPAITFGLRNRPKVTVASKEARTFQGRVYHSAAEARYASELELRRRIGEIRAWRPQPRFRLEVQGHLVCVVMLDFEITERDGSLSYVEVKGWESQLWKLKRKLLAALYPNIRLKVVKA